jgi:hypothetical protein
MRRGAALGGPRAQLALCREWHAGCNLRVAPMALEQVESSDGGDRVMQGRQGDRSSWTGLRVLHRSIRASVTVGVASAWIWGAASATAGPEDPEKPAVIDFVDLGGIRDWRAEGNEALLVQSACGTWYRATFFGPCPGIQFREKLAFVTDGMNRLDRFSSVLVDRQRCWFRTFERIETIDAPGQDGAPEKK